MNTPTKYIAYSSRALLASVALLALGACSQKGPLEGTYASADATYVFKGDTVTATKNGSAGGSQMKYAVDGKKVTFTFGKYKYDGVINDDGSVSILNMTTGMKGEAIVDKLVKR